MIFLTFGLTCGGPVYYAWFNKIHNMPQFIERVVKLNVLLNGMKDEF